MPAPDFKYDEAEIERMLQECLELMDEEDHPFSSWEVSFLESVEDQNETRHLTEDQVAKLEQIYEERCQ